MRIRDEAYLDYIREKRCCACQKTGPSDPHHIETVGMGTKGSDLMTVPLCRECHRELHQRGKATFQDMWQLNLYREALRNLERYVQKVYK